MSRAHRTAEWHRNSRLVRKIIRGRLERGEEVRCTNCGKPIQHGQLFDVGHIVDDYRGGSSSLSNLGGAHRRCNRSDGGRAGAAARVKSSRQARRLPSW
jgi:5-methylcytosine-specific restriction endonuclease McrA